MRALLLKPAALGAIVGLAFFGTGMIFTSFAVRAAITATGTTSASTICASPPASPLVLTAQEIALTPNDSASPSDSISPTDSPSTSSTDTPSPSPSSTDTPSPSTPSTEITTPPASGPDTTGSSSSSIPGPPTSLSTSPSPSPAPSAPPPTPQLCVKVQTYPSTSTAVMAGGTASFVVWVWSTGAASTNVKVLASVTAASYLGTPSYAICPSASGATCTIASLPVGQVYELLVSEPVSASAPAAAHVAFTAKASASGALSFSASATEFVAARSSSALPSSSTALPPLVQSLVPPLFELPPIPGTSVSPVNPSDLFPTVSPSPGNGGIGLPGARSRSGVHAAAVSSTVPIDTRLIGAQLVGLAVLAGAVTIAIMRMSLRRRAPGPNPAPTGDSGHD